MSQVISLFSSPLYVSQLKEEALEGVLDFAKNSIYTPPHEDYVTHTLDDYIIDKLPKFKKSITEKIDDYFYNFLKIDPALGYYFPDSWFLKCSSLTMSRKHSHSNSLFSGVVYIDSENKGDITFFRPGISGSSLGSSKTLLYYTENNLINLDHWTVTPENRKILIFPSFLEHKVHKNLSNEDRYSFAFNILLENYKCIVSTSKVLER